MQHFTIFFSLADQFEFQQVLTPPKRFLPLQGEKRTRRELPGLVLAAPLAFFFVAGFLDRSAGKDTLPEVEEFPSGSPAPDGLTCPPHAQSHLRLHKGLSPIFCQSVQRIAK